MKDSSNKTVVSEEKEPPPQPVQPSAKENSKDLPEMTIWLPCHFLKPNIDGYASGVVSFFYEKNATKAICRLTKTTGNDIRVCTAFIDRPHRKRYQLLKDNTTRKDIQIHLRMN